MEMYSGNHIRHIEKQLQTPYAVLLSPAWCNRLRIQQFISLLLALPSLNSLLVHLLSHLLIALLFFLGCSAVFDCLDVSLYQRNELA